MNTLLHHLHVDDFNRHGALSIFVSASVDLAGEPSTDFLVECVRVVVDGFAGFGVAIVERRLVASVNDHI